jgi:hypothetical protein
MRFFRSRVSTGYVGAREEVYFVTSEQGPDGIRRYSVRHLDSRDGQISTVGEFQQHATRARAISEAKRHARESLQAFADDQAHH